jgi:transposase
MGRKPKVTKHISNGELEGLYKNEKDARVKERLLAISLLYDKKNIYEIAEVLKRSERTIKDWLSRWNKGGYEGLIPSKGGGADPKMPLSEWDNILKEIEGKGMTIKDIVAYVKSNRDVDYSYKTVWRILRVKKKVKYGKPYIRNEKRPKNAEAILKKE